MSAAATVRWGHSALQLEIEVDAEGAAHLTSLEALTPSGRQRVAPSVIPLVEVRTHASGSQWSGGRVVDTLVGSRLRYRRHREEEAEGRRDLVVELADAGSGLAVSQRLTSFDGVPALRSSVEVANEGDEPVVLLAVSSIVVPLDWARSEVTLWHADDDWCGEFRWRSRSLGREVLPQLLPVHAHGSGRNSASVRSEGQWSTRYHLPMGMAERAGGGAVAWEVESASAWRWEVGELGDGFYVGAEGPTDVDGGWDHELAPGERFTAVSASVALVGGGWQDAVGALTAHRRASRTAHPAFSQAPVVYNDYLKALEGDPTEASLEPLIASVAAAGADVFCIDAGWYDDDDAGWWDAVGGWQPSGARFPSGLENVLGRIRELGMVPGLWVEPEVVGVRSPVAEKLPDGAFFTRRGRRVVEHGRYHLDVTHPAARAHIDEVVDRLVGMGAGYFKFDYNISGAHGTDSRGRSPGDGRLQHARAYLDWLESLLARHPGLILENCSSGGMRADAETLKHVQLQQSSDQDDTALVLPISAAGLAAVPPEQLAMWCYPDVGTSDAETRMALATALIGRFHLSGNVSALTERQQELLATAVAAHKDVRAELVDSTPFWPVGLPAWDDDWVVVGLRMPSRVRLVVTRRSGTGAELTVPLAGLGLRSPGVVAALGSDPQDSWSWDAASSSLAVTVGEAPGGLVLDLF